MCAARCPKARRSPLRPLPNSRSTALWTIRRSVPQHLTAEGAAAMTVALPPPELFVRHVDELLAVLALGALRTLPSATASCVRHKSFLANPTDSDRHTD